MNSNQTDDPYSGLIVHGDDLDRELLAQTAMPYIRIYIDDNKNARIGFTEKGLKLPNRLKVLAFLLGRKVLKDKSLIQSEPISPSDLEKEINIKGNSLRPTLGTLLNSNYLQTVEGDKGNLYSIPNYAVSLIANEMKGTD